MSEHVSDGSLDVDFYRSYHPDLAGFDDDFLRRHYHEHGRAEGRLANFSSFITDLIRRGKPSPSDFDADEYVRLNPDLARTITFAWQAYHHYAFFGEAEGRTYNRFDLSFYSNLYFDGRAITSGEALAHFRSVKSPEIAFRSLDEMLLHYNVPGGTWLKLFDARDFRIINYRSVPATASREQCLKLFLGVGIESLMRFSSRYGFDLAFYRELTGLDGAAAACYLHWLTDGLDAGVPATQSEWLQAHGLELTAFPEAFSWRLFEPGGGENEERPAARGRWAVLTSLIADRTTAPARLPIRESGGGALLEALAKLHLSRGDLPPALGCAERAALLDGASVRHQLVLGDCYYGAHRWSSAADCYRRFHDDDRPTLWSVCRLADALANLGRFDEAIAALRLDRAGFAGERRWRETVESVVQRLFDRRSEAIKTRYADGDRAGADGEVIALVDQLYALITDLVDLPVKTHRVEAKAAAEQPRVIMLANFALPQCTFYRVDQKRDFFTGLDSELTVFTEADVDAFIGAIPFADVAIFYRVVAAPGNLRAIAAANSAGIRTFYEVDDLVFDSASYPDSLESFEGQITAAQHVDLMYSVPLFRAMMSRCDFAIASTEPLARRMAEIVAEARAFVVRNGLHHRTMKMDRAGVGLRPATDTIRVFYGSGTLNHNRDFNELVAPALCELMARDRRVELVIAGHLKLAPIFARFAGRIERLPFIDSVDAYWSVLAGCDINLAVLAPGSLSDCKSEIKWLEAALFAVPSIVSATATYIQVVEPGVTGLVARDAAEWREMLDRLVADPQLRAAIGATARERALTHYAPQVQARAMREAIVGASRPITPAAARKPRLLVVNVFFPPQAIGGATRVVANNVDDWLDAGLLEDFDLAIAAADYDGEPAYQRRNGSYRGVPVFRIATPADADIDWRPFDPRMGVWFEEILDVYAPDLVHFHCVQRLTASTVASCQNRGLPYLVSAHDGWWVSDFQFLFDEDGRARAPGDEIKLGSTTGIVLDRSLDRQARLRPLLRGANAVLAPSETFARIYRDAGIANASSVANGLSPMNILPRSPSRTGRVRLGHVGNTRPHKGFDLIEAALKNNDFRRIELLALDHGIHGGDYVDELWGSTPVRRSGAVAQERMNEVYAQLDVLLAPSAWNESFGLVAREAHAAGLWVVAGNRGAIGADVREGVDGFVVDVTDPVGVERALARINDDPERFLKPIKRRPLRSAADQAAELSSLYRQLLGAR